MKNQPVRLSYEIELQPGEKLTLPEALAGSVGPGRWIITVKPAPRSSAIRRHKAFLNGYAPQDEGLYDDTAR